MSKKPIIDSMKKVGEMFVAGVAVEEREKIASAASKVGRFMMESFTKGHQERTEMLTGQGSSLSPSTTPSNPKVKNTGMEK